ncbi:MAG: Esterase/lipase [uncultured Thermomicrobiales bacterium]|uniref:Esterase/lipase n=1 Tax=uncultured Thermomicrobiales bacterium TaxID=1645740 RepID=A0A6J4UYE0_9BACT|nr:MAG: Esterase/lipase [uncultured Thermomicrobiales bacterium]
MSSTPTLRDPLALSRRILLGATAAGALALTSGALAQDATPGTPVTPGSPVTGGPAPDAQMQEVLDALAAFEAPPLESVTPEIGRNLPSFANALQAVIAAKGLPAFEPVGAIEHILIPSADGEILARIYRPLEAGSDALPVLVYFHGGGFVIANLDTYDASCRALTNATGCIVASIAYRQAPEHSFPAPVDDAYAATQYFLENAGDIGGDPAKVAVAGESAGGNLAAVVSLRARDEGAPMPVHQLLVYPVTTFAPEGEAAASLEQFADARPLNAAMLEWFTSHYLPDPGDATDPEASPLEAEDLSDLPPTTVILAEIDPLQSQGAAFAERLEEAGVDVSLTLYQGVTHEFFGMGAVVDKAAEAVDEAAARLTASFEAV